MPDFSAGRKIAGWLALSAVVIGLDLYTKHQVQSALMYGEHHQVTSFFDIVLFYNEGAAFSFLAGAGGGNASFSARLRLLLPW